MNTTVKFEIIFAMNIVVVTVSDTYNKYLKMIIIGEKDYVAVTLNFKMDAIRGILSTRYVAAKTCVPINISNLITNHKYQTLRFCTN